MLLLLIFWSDSGLLFVRARWSFGPAVLIGTGLLLRLGEGRIFRSAVSKNSTLRSLPLIVYYENVNKLSILCEQIVNVSTQSKRVLIIRNGKRFYNNHALCNLTEYFLSLYW